MHELCHITTNGTNTMETEFNFNNEPPKVNEEKLLDLTRRAYVNTRDYCLCRGVDYVGYLSRKQSTDTTEQ